MNEVAEKFIDLGIDDGPISIGDDMNRQREKIRKEFSKLNFVLEIKNFDLPKGSEETEILIGYEDPKIAEDST